MNKLVFHGAALLLALTLGAAGGKSFCEGKHAAKLAKAQSEMIAAAELASRKEQDRLALEKQLDLVARELEDASRNDPGAGSCGLSANSVRRLNKY